MDAYTFKNPGFYDAESNDTLTIRQLVTLCAELQSDIAALRAQVAELVAMRDTLNAVFTIEAPAAGGWNYEKLRELSDQRRQELKQQATAADTCEYCKGSGKWTDNIGTVRLCGHCDGTGEVQP